MKTETEYRAIKMDSSSSLKDFSLDRKKYYKKYILGEQVKEKENQAMNMGMLVETLLMEPELFDDKFYMSSTVKVPTGKMLVFVEALYRVSMSYYNKETKEIQKDFVNIVEEAYELSGYSWTKEKVLENFEGSDNEVYFNEILKVRLKNLIVVNTQDVTNAENIVGELKTNFVTQHIVNLKNSDRFEIINQFPIENYDVYGHPFKSLLDKVIIDHETKTITPYDLKCTWSVENFYEEYYLFRRAYIQGFLYYHAVKSLCEDPSSKYYKYSPKFIKFIVCDSIDYMNPLIYPMYEKDMLKADLGFSHKGRNYPGVKKLVSSLKWSKKSNIWNITKENYETKGIATLE